MAALATAIGPAASGASAAATAAATSHVIPGTSCRVFPANDVWHADVSQLPVNPRSAQWLSHMSTAGRFLHPDFGPSGGYPYGIPITFVTGSHPKVHVGFTYADESDPGPYPLGSDTKIEGGPGATGDRHAVVLDKSTCTLYETFATYDRSGWHAGSGATWSLSSSRLRPAGWTSADAAGLPILAGLLRYGEVAKGEVDHAIRFTTDVTDRAYIWPARHQAGSVSNRAYPPMGARFRLKAGFDISHFGPWVRVVLRAMKRYGLILADNGSPWYFQGSADPRWPSTLISQLERIPASAFEAVDESSLMASSDSGAVRSP